MAVQTQIQVRRGTAASWTSTNPTLAAGEIGFESDTGKFKIGDGSSTWSSLTYYSPGAIASPLTTKGDLWTYTTTNARIGVGTNGQLLVADSTATPGIKWTNSVSNIDVTSSTIPANGIYLPSANTLGLATNSAVRMQINAVGEVGLGGNPSTGSTLWVTKTITGSASANGIVHLGTIQSDVTANNYYFRAYASTAAASFTLGTLAHFFADQGTFGLGSTVTTQIGFFAGSALTGGTNNYGFYGQIASGSARWNAYMVGTAANYFAGQTTVGSTSLTLGNGSVAQQFGVVSSAATNIVEVVRGAASQSGDLVQWQNSAGSVLAKVDSAGLGTFGNVTVTSSTLPTNGMYLPAANTLGFATNGSSRLQINSVGEIGIGATPVTGFAIQIEKNITGAAASYGINNVGFIQSGVTSSAIYYRTFARTANSNFGITAILHYDAAAVGTFDNVTAGGSVTAQYGFRVTNTLVGATSNFGFYGDIPSAANRWNFFANGTAANYFAGQTTVGSTSLTLGSSSAAQQFGVVAGAATTVGAVIRGAASQSADLQQWQNSAGTVLGRVTAAGKITSAAATAGIGYETGAGGTVTQLTNKSTGVTLNTVTGQITMNNAALAADTTVSFTLTDSAIAATDMVLVQHISAGTLGAYTCTAAPAAGSATIYVRNVTAGSLSEAIVLQFVVIKAVTA